MKKKKLSLLLFVLFVSVLLIVINFYTIKVLSSVRAYINGESEYSKGQKDASLYLATYLQTENLAHWVLCKQSINVPKGDKIARTSLQNNNKDSVTKHGFLIAKNHPDDVQDMIWLFKEFHSIPFMKKAIDIWASADSLIIELDTISNEIHSQIQTNKLSASAKLNYLKEIDDISAKLSTKESAFSQQLGFSVRNIKKYLEIANIFFILLLLGSIALYAVKMINSLSVSEKSLKIKNDELIFVNKELQHFSYIASHDLQEPLRMVSGFLEILKDKYNNQLDEKAHDYINFAIDGSLRMKKLINNLLEYSRTSSHNIEYNIVDFNKVVNDTKIILYEKITEKNAIITIDNLPEINANKMQMVQLFQNLISNALKYTSDKTPEINISVTATASHWLFAIKDNGLGIAKENFDKIFVIFQRLHSNKTHDGTGIGLAICKKIIESHKGELWVESEESKGSTFFFTISKTLQNIT